MFMLCIRVLIGIKKYFKPYSVYKQQNPNIHIFYSVNKKRNDSFPYKFGFGQIIQILYIPSASLSSHSLYNIT